MSFLQSLDPASLDAIDLRKLVLPRLKNRIACWGDSRVAQWHADSSHMNRSGYNHRTVGDCLAGRRTVYAGNFGVSGDRSDQALARLPAVIASGCGTLDVEIGANDIAQANTGFTCLAGPMAGQTIDLTNVLAMLLANVELVVQTAVWAMIPNIILTLDPGASNMNATQVGITIRYNQGLRELAEKYPGVVVFDLPAYLWAPTSSTSAAFDYVTNAMIIDAGPVRVHEATLGAQLAAPGYAALLMAIIPPFPRNIRCNAEQNSALNKTDLLLNPLFTTTSGGTIGAGITATSGVPLSWVTGRQGGSGNQTATLTTGPNPNGPGNEVIMACTFTAAGDGFFIGQDVPTADWAIGDVVESVSQAAVDAGSTGLAGTMEFLQNAWNSGAVSNYAYDNYQRGEIGLQTGYTHDYLTQPLVCSQPVLNATKSWLTKRTIIVGAAAGTATFRVRASQIRHRAAA